MRSSNACVDKGYRPDVGIAGMVVLVFAEVCFLGFSYSSIRASSSKDEEIAHLIADMSALAAGSASTALGLVMVFMYSVESWKTFCSSIS